MDNNEPVAGWRRKQFLSEMQGGDGSTPTKKEDKQESLKDLIGIKDIRYGVFEKNRNEYCVIISTDSVNFDLLNPSERGTIILGYQALFRVVNFPLQILGQAVRQDLRKEEKRFYENLKDANKETKAYNEHVISHIKMQSEEKFRITRRIYYVISYIYEPSKMGKLNAAQREKRIVETLYQQAGLVIKMLQRARIEADIMDSLSAMEVLKRALNRDRMLIHPIENIVEPGKEKLNTYITADPSTLPGFEELVQNVEEAKRYVSVQEQTS